MRVVIVDDELHARENIIRRIEGFGLGIKIVGTAMNVQSGYDLIVAEKPDLVFLDIEMPGEDGFALLDRFEESLPFKVIFVTAYNTFALRAFEYFAIGYITKPIDNDLLLSTINNAMQESNQSSGSMQELIRQVRAKRIRKVTVNIDSGFILLPADDVVMIESEDGYSKIHQACGKKVVTSRRLKQYDEILSDGQFHRVHRSYLVNLDHVVEYRKGGTIILSNGQEIAINKNSQKSILEVLKSQ